MAWKAPESAPPEPAPLEELLSESSPPSALVSLGLLLQAPAAPAMASARATLKPATGFKTRRPNDVAKGDCLSKRAARGGGSGRAARGRERGAIARVAKVTVRSGLSEVAVKCQDAAWMWARRRCALDEFEAAEY